VAVPCETAPVVSADRVLDEIPELRVESIER
jgi:hypothetical protein